MAKAVRVVGALCALTTVNAFVPTCSRVAVPSSRTSATNVYASSLPSVHCLSTTPAVRAARIELFSTPAASSDPVAATPVAPIVASGEKDGSEVKAAAGSVKVAAYFGLWYLFNIGYNIYNKRLLNVLPLPWMAATAQMGIGLFYVLPLWATKLRKAPKLSEGALGPLRYDSNDHNSSTTTVVVRTTSTTV